jgi:excisionase family DNA binding protein
MEYNSPERHLFDAKEIAMLLGLHLRTVQLLFRQGKIQGMKIGRSWKAYQSDIDAYLAAQRQAAVALAQAESRRD